MKMIDQSSVEFQINHTRTAAVKRHHQHVQNRVRRSRVRLRAPGCLQQPRRR